MAYILREIQNELQPYADTFDISNIDEQYQKLITPESDWMKWITFPFFSHASQADLVDRLNEFLERIGKNVYLVIEDCDRLKDDKLMANLAAFIDHVKVKDANSNHIHVIVALNYDASMQIVIRSCEDFYSINALTPQAASKMFQDEELPEEFKEFPKEYRDVIFQTLDTPRRYKVLFRHLNNDWMQKYKGNIDFTDWIAYNAMEITKTDVRDGETSAWTFLMENHGFLMENVNVWYAEIDPVISMWKKGKTWDIAFDTWRNDIKSNARHGRHQYYKRMNNVLARLEEKKVPSRHCGLLFLLFTGIFNSERQRILLNEYSDYLMYLANGIPNINGTPIGFDDRALLTKLQGIPQLNADDKKTMKKLFEDVSEENADEKISLFQNANAKYIDLWNEYYSSELQGIATTEHINVKIKQLQLWRWDNIDSWCYAILGWIEKYDEENADFFKGILMEILLKGGFNTVSIMKLAFHVCCKNHQFENALLPMRDAIDTIIREVYRSYGEKYLWDIFEKLIDEYNPNNRDELKKIDKSFLSVNENITLAEPNELTNKVDSSFISRYISEKRCMVRVRTYVEEEEVNGQIGFGDGKEYFSKDDIVELLLENREYRVTAYYHYYENGKSYFAQTNVQSQAGLNTVDMHLREILSIALCDDKFLDMVYVKAGKFTMSENDGENYVDEVPHEVTLTKGFYIGRYPVTQEQYTAVMGVNPSWFNGEGKNKDDNEGDKNRYPVEWVSWNDAMEFCEKLNEKKLAPEGYRFTLPTKTQWEYAAKGGVKTRNYKYSGSDNIDDVAWYDKNSGGKTHEVGTKAPNELGIYDMSGNVWEWCLDDWNGDSSKQVAEFRRENDKRFLFRVLRGGAWGSAPRFCRVACRSYLSPSGRNDLGFRLALVPESKQEHPEDS